MSVDNCPANFAVAVRSTARAPAKARWPRMAADAAVGDSLSAFCKSASLVISTPDEAIFPSSPVRAANSVPTARPTPPPASPAMSRPAETGCCSSDVRPAGVEAPAKSAIPGSRSAIGVLARIRYVAPSPFGLVCDVE